MYPRLFLDERDYEDGARPPADYIYDFDEMPGPHHVMVRYNSSEYEPIADDDEVSD